MALRGAIRVGRQANSSLFTIPCYLQTIYNVSASNPRRRLNPVSHNQTGTCYSSYVYFYWARDLIIIYFVLNFNCSFELRRIEIFW